MFSFRHLKTLKSKRGHKNVKNISMPSAVTENLEAGVKNNNWKLI